MSTVQLRTTSTVARRAGSLVGATVAAVAVRVVAGSVVGVDVAARIGGAVVPIGPVDVAVAALLAGLAGWALLALLERTTARARRVWTVTAILVLVVSLAGPPAGVDLGSVLTLAAMHLVIGAILIALLPDEPTG